MFFKKPSKTQSKQFSQFKIKPLVLFLLIGSFLIIVLISKISHIAFAFDFKIPKSVYFQGETIMISLPENFRLKSAFLGNRQGIIFSYKKYKRIIFGLSATEPPGNYKLRLYLADNSLLEKQITIKARKTVKINLGIPQQLALTPKSLVETINAKKSDFKSIISYKTKDVFFNSSFALPLYDNRKISSYFGEIRSTGGQEIRHLGIDFAAPKGTPVAAINDGVVAKIGNDYLYGNYVIINHGAGIYSLYLHLNQINISDGKKIKKGEIVGEVGSTGYATAPHLHLSVTVDGISVDPLQFISVF